MGAFSWCTSDTKKSIPCCIPFGDLPGTVYLLNPFGKPYKETDYEGYGEFGGQDVYALVADWNRKFLSEHPDCEIPQHGSIWSEEAQAYLTIPPKRVEEYPWYSLYSDSSKSHEEIEKAMRASCQDYWEYRYIGIDIACYDDQNAVLQYPIKLVEAPVPYEQAGVSPGCPYQGCIYPDSMRELRQGVAQAFAKLAQIEAAAKANVEPEREEEPTKLTPYRIAITETYTKEVEIYAEDELAAHEMAEGLCSEGVITLDADHFVDRSTECRGVARSIDLSLHEVFGCETAVYAAEPHQFIFDDEFVVSSDFNALEGYIWATDALVARLEAQEPPLEENQERANINFYPVYNVKDNSISLEGHYYIEDAHYARGRDFTLPLSAAESKQLISDFEAYCEKLEGVSCRDFLNQVRKEHNVPALPEKPFSNLIDSAVDRASQQQSTLDPQAPSASR